MQRLCKYVECFLHLQKSSPSPSAGFLGTQPMNLSAPEREHKKVNYCHPPIYPSCYPFSQHIYSDAAFILHPVLIYPLLSNPTFKTILIYYPPSPMSVCRSACVCACQCVCLFVSTPHQFETLISSSSLVLFMYCLPSSVFSLPFF